MKKLSVCLLLGSALALAGCASTIGNRADISSVTFEVGKTNKDTVANKLGLPADISRSEALGREYWAYGKKPELVGVMYALPSGPGTATTYNVSTGETGAYEFEDAAVIELLSATDYERFTAAMAAYDPQAQQAAELA